MLQCVVILYVLQNSETLYPCYMYILFLGTKLRTQNSDIFYLTLLIDYQNYCRTYIHIS